MRPVATPTIQPAWIAEVERERKRLERELLGVNLTYHPDGRVQVGAGGRVLRVRVGGGTQTLSTRDAWETCLVAA